jgi:hypothetical protein
VDKLGGQPVASFFMWLLVDMKVRRFILQEYDNRPMPGWRSVDGTVCNTREEAEALLKEFKEGRGYSIYGINKFRIEEYMGDS